MKKIVSFFKSKVQRVLDVDIKHYIAFLLIAVSSGLGVLFYNVSYERFIQNIIDLGRSCVFFFKKFFMLNESYTVDLFPADLTDISRVIPIDIDKLLDKLDRFTEIIFTLDNFRDYLVFILLAFIFIELLVCIGIPVYIIFCDLFESIYLSPSSPDDKFKESKMLIFFKSKIENKLICVYNSCKSFVLFMREKKLYLKALIVIWMFNFNLTSLVVLLLAVYIYFITCLAISSLADSILKGFVDFFIAFIRVPLITYFVAGYIHITSLLKDYAYDTLEHHELCNRGFINEQPLGTLICASMGAGKTTMAVDMGLSTSVMFKEKALEILIKHDMRFPNFPWLRFEDDLKQCYKNHIQRQEDIKERGLSLIPVTSTIYNLASSKYWVLSKYQEFIKEPCPDKLWGYDFVRYGRTYDDDLTISDLFDSLITYSKAYLIYITQCSLIFGNLPVREDWFCSNGYLPTYVTDFFHRSPGESAQTSRFAKIFDYDMFRLGKKMVENNRNSNAFEFGVVILTEIGKERKNSLENRENKRKDDKVNQNNDLFDYSIKMIRHRATVDFFPFVRIISDEQRPESLGANVRDTFSVIRILQKSKLKVLYRGLIFDSFVHGILWPRFKAFYKQIRDLRGDNTLFVYLLKNVFSALNNRFEKLENRFGYYELDIETSQGNLEGEKKISKYYLSTKKIYSDRFTTDAYSDFFEKMSLRSGVGIFDFVEYQDKRQTEDEMELQNSFFYIDMSTYTLFKNV
ncbi:MAG: hypothetical protein J6C61_03430 [Clostridia bacterium]|nr:hypothetical protein [Clostridia bacterium]